MKTTMLLFLVLPLYMHAQEEETFDLQWKLFDTITYRTIVEDIFIEEEQSNEKVDSVVESSKSFFKQLQDQAPELKYESRLHPDKNGNVDVTMFLYEVKRDTNNNIIPNKHPINKNVAVRGKLNQEGKLISFYYKNVQSNLIALLFELPDKPVKLGETWNLAIDIIGMDQHYVADTLYKKNEVYLDQILEKDGDKIAVIKYNIEEYISGKFDAEFTLIEDGKDDENIFMKVTHQAVGHFSITNGMWITYDGVMEIDTNFSVMGIGGKKQTVLKLIPASNKTL